MNVTLSLRSGWTGLGVLLALACLPVWAGDAPVSGTVVNGSGDAVAGAEVNVVLMGQAGVWELDVGVGKQTGADGRFAFTADETKSELPYAFYVARQPEYGIAWALVMGTGAGGPSGVDPSDVRIVLPGRESVEGTVTDGDGQPVGGAVVTAFIALRSVDNDSQAFLPANAELLNAQSGADGSFALEGLPAGATVMLRAEHDDYAMGLEGAPSNLQGGMLGSINVGARDVSIALLAPSVVEGTVRLEGGTPAEGAKIVGQGAGNQIQTLLRGTASAEADSGGRYRLDGLADGSYTITAEHADGVAAPLSVTVPEGGTLTGQDLVLGKGVSVTGKVVYAESGEPEPDANVMVNRSGGMAPRQPKPIAVDEDGSFSFREPAGEISVIAFTPTGGNARTQLTLVADEDVTGVTLELPKVLAFKGKVVGPKKMKKGLAGALVRQHAGSMPIETDEDGTFELPMPNQRLGEQHNWATITATHPDHPGYRGIIAKQLMTEADAAGVIEMKRTATLRGRVVDEEGNPMASATVTPFFKFDNMSRSDSSITTGEDGGFEDTSIIGGQRHYAQATADGYGQNQSDEFTIEGGQSLELPDFVLAVADQVIEGTVVDEDGAPLANVHVSTNGQKTPHRSVQSDSEGHFKLENLVAEELNVSGWQNVAGNSLHASMKVMAGNTEGVELVLKSQSSSSSQQDKAPRIVGKAAPALDVAKWIQGGETTLAALEGKVVALGFWDATDESASEFLGLLLKLSQDDRVAAVAVHVRGGDAAAAKTLAATHAKGVPTAMDSEDGATFKRYGVKKPPALYLIDTKGTLQYQDLPLPAAETAVAAILQE